MQNTLSFNPKHISSFKGDVGEAKKMIAAAAEAGADCVKFQKSCLKVTFSLSNYNPTGGQSEMNCLVSISL